MASVNKSLKSAAAVLSLIAGESVHAQGFTETFGNAAGRVSNSYVIGFGYAASGGVTDGNYTVMPPQNVSGSTGQPYWANLTTDHTGTADGALMVLNAGSDYDDIYRRDFTMLPGHTYRVTGWRYVVNGANSAGSSDSLFWGIQIRDPQTNQPLRDPVTNDVLYDSGNLGTDGRRLEWVKSEYQFKVALNCTTAGVPISARLAITNRSPVTGGNDLYVDDISVEDVTPAGSVEQACYKPVPALGAGGLGLLGLLGAVSGALALHRRKRGTV